MRIPYGEADFYNLRTEGQIYVDRTAHIAVVEELGKRLLFLRPRRFGKSLWLSTLAAYYDLRTVDEHEQLFGDLAVGKTPTPLAHRFFVMRWDFSEINPDPPRRGVNAEIDSRPERIANEIHEYLLASVRDLLIDYQAHLPQAVEVEDDAFRTLDKLLALIRQTPYRLYLLIDEYDNFANDVLSADQGTYEDLVHSDGPFKFLFKWVKAAMGGGKGLDRLFITGVSPLVMSDVTSGMNVAKSVYLKPALAGLCGFTDAEVDDLLAATLRERRQRFPREDVGLSEADAKLMMREWYNGYRFALGVEERVYNPTLVFYFLLEILEEGKGPRQMLDANLAASDDKLDQVVRLALGEEEGQGSLVDLILKNKPVATQLRDRFKLQELLEASSQDAGFVASYLFYLGMLTLRKDETEQQTVELVVPNEVMHSVYVERLRKTLMPRGVSRTRATTLLSDFLRDGDLLPLCDFIETTLFPTFSNRDARWANELTVKTIFLSLLWNDAAYITHSEPELDHGYADLCLLRRPDARTPGLWDLLFEFKRLSLKDLKMSGKDIGALSRAELTEHALVRDALDEAEVQIGAYRTALAKRLDKTPKLRGYAVVALGFKRLVVRAT